MEEKIIGINKVKTLLLILGCLGFAAGGAWLLTLDAGSIESQQGHNSPTMTYGAGVYLMVFFGLSGIWCIRNLFDRSQGLIINQYGLTDNSSGVSVGFVPWSEVVEIIQIKTQPQKFISIVVKDPDRFANRGNFFQRWVKAGSKRYGMPINIASNNLKMSHDELFRTLEEYFRYYRRRS